MEMISVKSSNISQIGFDEKRQMSFGQEPLSVMRIVFKNGAVYDYYRVPKSEFESLIKAESVGIYFHKHIKKYYHYEKV